MRQLCGIVGGLPPPLIPPVSLLLPPNLVAKEGATYPGEGEEEQRRLFAFPFPVKMDCLHRVATCTPYPELGLKFTHFGETYSFYFSNELSRPGLR